MSERRTRRGFGPFSGAQCTAIVIVFAVLLLAPVGAWAVAGSNVFVTDPGSGSRAYVTGAGQLNATAAGAKAFVKGFTSANNLNRFVVIKPAAGRALVITTIAVDTYRATQTGPGEQITAWVSIQNATCSHVETFPLVDVNPSGPGETVYPFNPGVVVPAGRALCANTSDPPNVDGEVFAYGYSIPATAAPSGASDQGTGAQVQQK